MQQQQQPTIVTVLGCQGNSDPQALLKFLKRHCKEPLTSVIETQVRPPDTIALALTEYNQAKALLKLSGIRYAGQKLKILIEGRGGSENLSSPMEMTSNPSLNSHSPSSGTRITDIFTAFILSRYEAPQKYLNMENIMADSNVASIGINIFTHESSNRIGPVLCKLIANLCPGVETISFANNRLRSLNMLTALPSHIPNLINLSFQNNNLGFIRDIDCFPGKDLQNLREVVFKGNPFVDRELGKPGGDLRYKSIIKKIFPTIQALDMVPVVEEITFGIDASAIGKKQISVIGPPVKESFVESEPNLVQDFVSKYFSFFDQSRPGLLNLYGDTAIFSLCINPNPSEKGPLARSDRNFDAWWSDNRNLDRTKQTDKRLSLLKVGPEAIMSCFTRLPETIHPINEPKKIIYDSITLEPKSIIRLCITTHGELLEGKNKIKRSFDRTFILVPSVPGSRAALAGIPFTIINDQLIIRCFTNNYEWEKAESSKLQGLDPLQRSMVLNFSQSTNLKHEFSLQCLSETGWDLSKAMAAFQSAKAQNTIPMEAFL